MENQITRIITDKTRFRVKYEHAAGVKSGDGFTVEAEGDDMDAVAEQAEAMYVEARVIVSAQEAETLQEADR